MINSSISYISLHFALIFALIIYIFSPPAYSEAHVDYSFYIFLYSALILNYNNVKRNHSILIFETLFTFSFLFVNFIYPTVIYKIDPYFSLFSRHFNENVMSKATALATVGYVAFSIGIFQRDKRRIINTRELHLNPISNGDLAIMTILLILFIVSNIAAFVGGYAMSGGGGFFFIFCIFYIYKYFAFSHNKISSIKRNHFLLLICIFIVMNLIMGNRGEPLYLCVAIVLCYNQFVKKIKLTKILILAIGGLLVFYVIGKVRISSNQVGVHSQSEKLASLEAEDNVLRYGNELIINNRSLYVLVDYADRNGYTFGQTWSMNFFSMVPYGQSFALQVLEIPPKFFSSTYLTTALEFSPDDKNSFGLGTNLIGDIYLCFGLIGVMFFMFLFGTTIKYVHNRSFYRESYYQILYIIFLMLAIYYPRATLFSPLQMIAWTYALTLIYRRNVKKTLRSL